MKRFFLALFWGLPKWSRTEWLRFYFFFALSMLLFAAAAHAQAPAPAAAAGYNTRTLGPAVTMGTNWFSNDPNAHITTNGDGSVTLGGPWDFNAQIISGDGHSFGTAFGGGGYFEMDFRWDNAFDASGGPPGWPAWWANSAEGRTIAASPNWPNGSAGGGDAIEWDIFEFFGGGWGPTVWDWSVNGNIGTSFSQFNGAWNAQGNVVDNTTNSFSGVRHKIAGLWIPATATTQGRVDTYLDGVLRPAMTQHWNKWSTAVTPPLQNGTTADSIMDLQHFMMLAGSSTSNPMTVFGISIWQKDGTANLPPTNVTPPAVSGSDMLAMCSDVGGAVNGANPGVLVICEGPINNGATLFSGATNGTVVVGDLSLASTKPVTGVPSNKTVYSVHDFPCNLSGACPDSGTTATTTRNVAWGYLQKNGTAPVFVGEMGCSCDGSNGNLTDDNAWATSILSYVNGGQGANGGPVFTGTAQPISTSWYQWGNQAGQNPNGTLNPDGSFKAGQQADWLQLLFATTITSGGQTTTWNPSDKSAAIALANNNLTATTSGTAEQTVRATSSKITGKFCWQASADTVFPDWTLGLANATFNLANVLGSEGNAIGLTPNSGGANQGIWFLAGALSSGPGTTVNGDTIMECADFDNKLLWATDTAMIAAGNTYNSSPTANPATGVGGVSFAGMACPCFPAFYSTNTAGAAATLGTTGPFLATTPAGFSPFDTVSARRHISLILQ